MKIKSIKLKNFKRFTDLTIEGLPETAKTCGDDRAEWKW